MGFFDKIIGGISSAFTTNPLGVIAGGLSLLNGFQQTSNQKAINERNIAMQQQTNEMQERMFNQNLAWQKESQQMQNEYNSAKAQVQRALEAGLSPMTVAGASPATASTGSAGSPIPSLTAPSAEMINSSSQNVIGTISEIAGAIANISKAGSDDAQRQRTLKLLNDELAGLQLDNNAKKMQNALLFTYGDKMKQAEYDLLIAKKANELSQVLLNEEMTDTEKEKQLNLISDALLKDSQRLLNKKEYQAFEQKLNAYLANVRADIKLKGAQTYEAETQAETNKAQAYKFREEGLTQESVRTLNKSMSDLNDARKELTEVDTDWAKRTKMNRIKQEYEKLRQLRLLNDEQENRVKIAQYEMEQAEYANDMKAFTYWSNFAFGIFDRGISLLNGAKGTPRLPFTHDAVTHDMQEEYIESNTPYYNTTTGDTGVHKSHKTTKTYKKR